MSDLSFSFMLELEVSGRWPRQRPNGAGHAAGGAR